LTDKDVLTRPAILDGENKKKNKKKKNIAVVKLRKKRQV